MSPTALALVMMAAILHATWNLIAKRAQAGSHFTFLTAVGVSVVWAPAAAWVMLTESFTLTWVHWLAILASAIIHWGYFHILLRGYAVSDLSVVYPVARGTGPLISSAAAVVLLGEVLKPLGIIGVLAIAGGVFFIAGGVGLLKRNDPKVRLGLAWGTLTGASIAAYTVVDGYAVKVLGMSAIFFDWIVNVLRLGLQGPWALRDPQGLLAQARTHWKPALAIAVLAPAGYMLVLTAMKIAPISHVAPAREMSMLVATLFGAKLLGEGDVVNRMIGALCIAGGVMMLALS